MYRTWELSTGMWEPLIMGTASAQNQELSIEMVKTPHNGHSRCIDLGNQHRDGGSPSYWVRQVCRPSKTAEGWGEPLIMGKSGVLSRGLSTGMVGAPHNGHSRCTDLGTQHRDGKNPSINGHSRCSYPGTQHKDGGSSS